MKKANPINITHIDHVVIRVIDLESMIAFYQDVLGCKLERGPGESRLAQLRAGNSLIDLVDANGPLGQEGGDRPVHAAPNMDHVCFQVQPWDTNTIKSHLELHGINSGDIESRYGASGMGPSVYLSDPEGNRVELKGSTSNLKDSAL
ncbi:MAG: catechol 2,3-dioxygenase-like lactoylglutathione lyase family enzyme [Gammaproteobacteria bacterium]|jgi:catechol 2,3-dioxygenase-like lactoylglutathione lyase family enzyme